MRLHLEPAMISTVGALRSWLCRFDAATSSGRLEGQDEFRQSVELFGGQGPGVTRHEAGAIAEHGEDLVERHATCRQVRPHASFAVGSVATSTVV